MSESYLILGGGRVARNLEAYLNATGAGVSVWTRRSGDEASLRNAAADAECILLAVSDAAIAPLAAIARAAAPQACICHFSAVVETPDAGALHPLAAFPSGLFDRAAFEAIPFIELKGGLAFRDMFPAWRNPVFAIAPDQRTLYHALLVLSGNLCSLIWNETARVLQDDMSLPAGDLLDFYIRTNLTLLREAPMQSFSGPVRRGDAATLRANLAALAQHESLRRSYELLLDLKWPGGAAGLRATE